jgi:hypothetical protein
VTDRPEPVNHAEESPMGWNFAESKQVLEWQAQAQARTLVKVLKAKFIDVPEELASAIRVITDPDRLDTWAVLAAKAASLEQFRRDAEL